MMPIKRFWIPAVLLLSLIFSGITLAPKSHGIPWNYNDLIYLANGQTIECHIKGVSGDFIEYSTRMGEDNLIKRLQLASKRDLVEAMGGKKYLGEVLFMGKYSLKIETAQGKKEIWRIKKNRIVLGIPSTLREQPAESDSQLQAPPKTILK